MCPCISPLYVTDLFDLKDLVSRPLADELAQHIRSCACPEVRIDFSGIATISRAFADQFHKHKLEALAGGKTVIAINMEPEVLSMFQAVVHTQGDFNRKYEQTPIFQFRNRKELKEFLFAF